ncbi:2-oxo-4-hydroxy-4-carboxy-5-ureidoimidazoline decarboxylase [Vibrio mytili]|nr:2-oxo-4-hydroxy-4-carboxy-5-ureidoimidazoline decarboxylase [Vibrio mytili]
MSAANHAISLSNEQLERICTSQRWQQAMIDAMPFDSAQAVFSGFESAFAQLEENDWLEAFAGHPMIGDLKS